MNRQLTLPLFPLHAVLFPGGPLRLRIFEARYVDMVGRCMRTVSEFGVAMIVEGDEVGPARTARIGTTARIRDFETLSGGLLGIVASGARRFKIQSVSQQNDGLNIAECELLAAEVSAPIPDRCASLVDLIRQAYPQVSMLYGDAPPRLDDAGWLSSRLAELLPFTLAVRQHCLELDDPLQRLAYLQEWMTEIP